MPEGDVVWRTADRLHRALAGRTLTRCDLRWPSLATADLTGRQVLEVVSAGKHLLVRMDARPDAEPGSPDAVRLTLHSHLRMEGSWRVQRTPDPWRSPADRDTRALLANQDWTAIGHRLGMLDLVATTAEDALVGHLGPDLLGPGWDADQAVANLLSTPQRAVGEALLDQRVLAGVGTFYLSEALFLRGRTPWTPVADLGADGVRALVDLLHRLLTVNATRAIQITTGDSAPGRRNFAHARSGRPCLRCGTTVRVAMVGQAPKERTAFYCPACQSGPAPTDDGAPQAPLGAGRRRARSGSTVRASRRYP